MDPDSNTGTDAKEGVGNYDSLCRIGVDDHGGHANERN
jgi:hypothetical protein